jgi:hypothetical protein
MSLSPNQIDILKHTSRTGRYVSNEPDCATLADSGLLHDHGPQALAAGDHYYTLTATGRKAIADHLASLPKPPPISRRKQRAKDRYRRFIDHGDAFPSFLEFLKADSHLA